jgi:hypothetical protein
MDSNTKTIVNLFLVCKIATKWTGNHRRQNIEKELAGKAISLSSITA